MIRYSPKARADLHYYSSRITADNGIATADRVTGRIAADIEYLERFPQLGRAGRRAGTRN